MSQSTSQYLDLLRLLSALAVFAAHALQGHTARAAFGGALPDGMAHHAVIVFFVLSGYVIGFATHRKEKDWLSYGLARFTRIAPVVFAAILLTLTLDTAGRVLAPHLYGQAYQYDSPFKYILLSIFISNHSWILAEPLFSNAPYWSINYEAWYYILFAFVFFSPGRVKYFLIGLWLLAVGIKIPLLLPCWLFGYWAFCATTKIWPVSLDKIWVLLSLGISAEIIFLIFGICTPIHNNWEISNLTFPVIGVLDLGYSRYFLTDWLFAAMHAVHIACIARVATRADWNLPLKEAIKFGADRTFGLYIFHLPLLLFMRALTAGADDTVSKFALITAAAFAVSLLLASIVEPLRFPLRRIFTETANPILQRYRAELPLSRAPPKR